MLNRIQSGQHVRVTSETLQGDAIITGKGVLSFSDRTRFVVGMRIDGIFSYERSGKQTIPINNISLRIAEMAPSWNQMKTILTIGRECGIALGNHKVEHFPVLKLELHLDESQ